MFSKTMQKNFRIGLSKLLQLFGRTEESIEKNVDAFTEYADIHEEIRVLAGDVKSLAARLSGLHERLEEMRRDDMDSSAAEQWLARQSIPVSEESASPVAEEPEKAVATPPEPAPAPEIAPDITPEIAAEITSEVMPKPAKIIYSPPPAEKTHAPKTQATPPPAPESKAAPAGLNLQALQSSMSSMKDNARPSYAHKTRYDDALIQLRNGISWQQPEMEKEARRELKKLEKHIPAHTMQEDIASMERRGATYVNFGNRLKKLLAQHDPLHANVLAFWADIQKHHRWFMTKFVKDILFVSKHICKRMTHAQSAEKAREYVESIVKHYGQDAQRSSKDLLEIIAACKENVVPVVTATQEHRIQCLEPEAGWVLYIDEAGQDFEKTTSDANAKVVGVLLPEKTTLRILEKDIHCKAKSTPAVLNMFNELLSTKCGILGLEKKDLHHMQHEQWFASVQELVAWVWRLLPLMEDAPVRLRVCIENRSTYNAKQDIVLFKKTFEVQREKEDAARRRRIEITDMEFVSKGTGHIGWADVAAYMWGSPTKEIKNGLAQSGLIGACYLSNISDILPLWEKIFGGDMLSGDEWRRLTQERTQQGSITANALRLLQERCMQDEELWRPYIVATSAYLESKEYDITVLERQCAWLSRMGQMEIVSPSLQFFWNLAELAEYNHQGDISPHVHELRGELESLSQNMAQLRPEAQYHAALRIAVSHANALDFTSARQCLAPWNPHAGGSCIGSALWDGKILSSLGQYAAFEGNFTEALQYFDEALGLFAKLSEFDAREGQRQAEQTSVYAAIAAMDISGNASAMPYDLRQTLRVQRLENALGERILDACHKYARHGSAAGRYLHHALVRYLAEYGTDEEKKAYCAYSQRWCVEDVGVGQGHPWPLIQWYRWYLLPASAQAQKDALMDSLFDFSWSAMSGATVDFIGVTLGLAALEFQHDDPKVQKYVSSFLQHMPCAAERIAHLQTDALSGLALVKAVLPFNYR